MTALFSHPSQFWPWLGILCLGAGCASLTRAAAREPLPWATLLVLPFGTCAYALLSVPSFALLPPALAPVATSALAVLAALASPALAAGFTSHRQRRQRRHRPYPAGASAEGRRLWLVIVSAAIAAALIAQAGATWGLAVAMGAVLPPLMGEPSSGDVALTALRSALIARHGVPPPSPLDPDFPLQYRYLFHTFAASFAVHHGADYAAITAAGGGLMLAGIASAGAALGWLVTRSVPASIAAGLLGPLYGPSYWLPDVVAMLQQGVAPTWSNFAALMGHRWGLSPLTPSFPSTFSSLAIAPALPAGTLAWLVTLLCAGAALRSCGPPSWVLPVTTGVALAALAFAADFFVPFAAAGLVCAAVVSLARAAPRPSARRLVVLVTALGVGLIAGLTLWLGATRQLAVAGAARDVRLDWNHTIGTTGTYGGNHALLAGGAPLPQPNWVHVHDWGLLFWPGLALALVLGVRRRDPVLAGGALAAALATLFWHLFTITYITGTPTNFRVQMYRFASTATAAAAPLVAIALVNAFAEPRGATGRAARAAASVCAVLAGAGAGLYLCWGALTLDPAPRPTYQLDAGLAVRLALEPPGARVAVLDGPPTFIEMYNATPAGFLPIYWARAGAAVPVGWDFGHPDYYEPLYRRVVADYDPSAAAQLGITHLVVTPDVVPPDRRATLAAFLSRCSAQHVATAQLSDRAPRSDEQPAPTRKLYRIEPSSCAER